MCAKSPALMGENETLYFWLMSEKPLSASIFDIGAVIA